MDTITSDDLTEIGEPSMTVEQYAVDLVAGGAESHAEDDTDEDGHFDDPADHEAAVALAINIAHALKADPDRAVRLGRAHAEEVEHTKRVADAAARGAQVLRVQMAVNVEDRGGKAVISGPDGEIGSVDREAFLAAIAKEFGVTVTPGKWRVVELPAGHCGAVGCDGTPNHD